MSATPAERLHRKLAVRDSGCIEWTGATNGCGYGSIQVSGRMVLVHRLAWELVNDPITDGLCVLHRCDNPSCCNVDHLSLGTHADNMADMVTKGRAGRRWGSAVTHCPQGHAYDVTNTYLAPSGKRDCRKCRAAASVRSVARRRAMAA